MQTYILNEVANKNDSQYDSAQLAGEKQGPVTDKDQASRRSAPREAARGDATPPVVDSHALFQGGTEVVIRHAGREYRLRRTRLGKLILTA
jgi:hemin uptake protein HemP